MNDQDILQKLKALMKRSSQAKVDWDALGDTAGIADLGFDSLSILDLIYDIQQDFGLDFDAREMAGVKTVAQLLAFLKSKGA